MLSVNVLSLTVATATLSFNVLPLTLATAMLNVNVLPLKVATATIRCLHVDTYVCKRNA